MRHLTWGVMIATLACAGVLVTPAAAEMLIMGDEPTITVQREGNTLLWYEVEGLMANKGIVQAQASDRFVLELSAEITDGTSVIDITFPATLLPLLADKDTSLKQGSEVDLTGVVQSLESKTELRAALDAGKPLTLTARVTLVLQDGSGARHLLGTIEATTIVSPC